MVPMGWLALVAAFVVLFALFSRALLENPRGDVEAGLLWRAMRVYARFFHRLRVVGGENIPRSRHPGPLVVVANHASGVDPVLIQAVCPFEIRWIMAAEMRHPLGEPFWEWCRIIFVARGGGGAGGTREALRHLREGGVLGIFPEGGIERPPRHILPFLSGVGFIIQRSGAPVLPIFVDGTPVAEPAWEALRRPSRAVLTILPLIDYRGSGLDAAGITRDLRRRFLEVSQWPEAGDVSEEPPASVPFPEVATGGRFVAGA